MKLFPVRCRKTTKTSQFKDISTGNGREDKYINLNHTKMLTESHPECKQIIRLPDNTCITDRNINQAIQIFEESNCDDLQYMVESTINIENMLININILPIVRSA